MAASSERKIEANRRNAARSTGPKSEEGKQKSRRNGWKHGMAAVVIVPAEETAALDASIAEWTAQIGPDGLTEASLVHQMAAADVRMKRCATIAENAMDGDAREAVRRWEARRQHAARRKAQDLKKRPAEIVADLEATSYGCDWMIRQWRNLETRLRNGQGWDRDQLDVALNLLGINCISAPTAIGDPLIIRLWTLASRANGQRIHPGSHFRPDPTVPENNWVEAHTLLRAFVAEQIERLEGLRDEAWEAVDGPAAEAVAAKALMDGGKEGQARHRYYRDAQLAQHRAAKLLMTIRDRKRKGESDAPKGVTGAAILESLCAQVVAKEKAEAATVAATASHRTEPNPPAQRTAEDRRNPNEKNELGNETAVDPAASAGRTEPRFPHVEPPSKGLGMGSSVAPNAPRAANGAA